MRHVAMSTVLTMISGPHPSAAVDGSTCDAARIRATVGLAKMSLACHAKAARLGEAVDADCLAKSEAKFAALYGKAGKPADCTEPGLTDATLSGMVDGAVTAFVATRRPQGDANLCAGRKLQGIATGTLALSKCAAVSAKKALAVDAQCTAKAGTKFDAAFVKAETKAASQGVPCFTTGDAQSVLVDLHEVVGDLSGEIYDPPSTPTPTAMSTRTATVTPTPTGAATFTGTATVTPPASCSGSAPACGGVCPFAAQQCSPNGTGGCRCVNIVSP